MGREIRMTIRRAYDQGQGALACGALGVSVLLLGACGGGSSGNSSGSGASSGVSSPASGSLAAVQAQLNAYSGVPSFTEPGPSFDAKKNAGKTVFNIDSSSTDPFFSAEDAGAKEALATVGVNFVNYSNQGQVSQWVQGINQAITSHADAIVLNGQNPSQLAPQIQQAEDAGIPVIEEHLYEAGQPLAQGIKATAYAPFTKAAQLMADYAISKTQGKVHALIVTSNDFLPSPLMQKAIEQEFRDKCGAGCRADSVNEVVTQWATGIQPAVQSALTQDPKINYVMPVFDSMTQYVVPAINAKGLQGKVHVATYNGTPFVLKYLQDGNAVQADIGENPAWIGYATMDQALRLMAKLPPAANEVTPLRVIDSGNVAETGTPPKLGQGYGSAYISGYKKLWGVGG
jgi:ribose transport system substrate-binding protein